MPFAPADRLLIHTSGGFSALRKQMVPPEGNSTVWRMTLRVVAA
jgi:hypothetical protein